MQDIDVANAASYEDDLMEKIDIINTGSCKDNLMQDINIINVIVREKGSVRSFLRL
jgi:hypothetical protein